MHLYTLFSFRSPNNPEARGSGEPCDDSPENLVDEMECGHIECKKCEIDGVEYAVSEVIEADPCGQTK